jgi:hypothetical protein
MSTLHTHCIRYSPIATVKRPLTRNTPNFSYQARNIIYRIDTQQKTLARPPSPFSTNTVKFQKRTFTTLSKPQPTPKSNNQNGRGKKEMHLFNVAKIAAQKCDLTTSYPTLRNSIKDEQHLFEIAKIAAKHNGRWISQCIQYYGIKDEKMLFEIAKIAANQDGTGTSDFIKNYGIKDEKMLFEIAKIAAHQSGKGTSLFIQKYGISNEQMLFEIAKIAAHQSGGGTSRFIQNYGIKDEQMLFEIAKIAAQQNGGVTSEFIENYGIKDEQMLFEIAKIAANQDGIWTSELIKNYGIKDEQMLFEIAKIAAQQNGSGTSYYIQNYGIKNEKMRFEIAKIAAQQNGYGTSFFIQKYGITNEQMRFEIAIVAAHRDGPDTSRNIKNFFPLSEKKKREIFKIAMGQDPDSIKFFNQYSFKDIDQSQVLKSIEFISNQKREDRNPHAVFLAFSKFVLDDLTGKQQNWVRDHQLIEAIDELRVPALRYELVMRLSDWINDTPSRTRFDELQKLEPQWILAVLLFVSLEKQGVKKAITNDLFEMINKNKKTYRNSFHFNPVLLALHALVINKLLTPLEKESVLNKMVAAFKEKNSSETTRNPKELLVQARLLQAVLGFGGEAVLKQPFPLAQCLETLFHQKVPLGTIDSFGTKWIETISSKFRNENLLFVYAGKLGSLPDPDRGLMLRAYGQFLGSVLEGTYVKERYNISNNPHLKLISSKVDLQLWKTNTKRDLSISKEEGIGNVRIDFTKILKQKILRDKHLDPNKFPWICRALHGEDVKKLLEAEREKFKNDKELSDKLYLESLLIQLKEGENPLKVLEEISKIPKLKDNYPDFEHDIQGLINGLKRSPSQFSRLQVSFTDDPCDLFLCGTEVEGSCQRVDGSPDLNKCLVGYLLNGTNRLVTITDSDGKIVARLILRLLWDEAKQEPVLFHERIYPSILHPALKQALENEVVAIAKGLKLPLTTDEGTTPYGGAVTSLGGPAPYEYSDGAGGVRREGRYVIQAPFLVE